MQNIIIRWLNWSSLNHEKATTGFQPSLVRQYSRKSRMFIFFCVCLSTLLTLIPTFISSFSLMNKIIFLISLVSCYVEKHG